MFNKHFSCSLCSDQTKKVPGYWHEMSCRWLEKNLPKSNRLNPFLQFRKQMTSQRIKRITKICLHWAGRCWSDSLISSRSITNSFITNPKNRTADSQCHHATHSWSVTSIKQRFNGKLSIGRQDSATFATPLSQRNNFASICSGDSVIEM